MQTNYSQSAQIPSFRLHSQTNFMLMSTKKFEMTIIIIMLPSDESPVFYFWGTSWEIPQ